MDTKNCRTSNHPDRRPKHLAHRRNLIQRYPHLFCLGFAIALCMITCSATGMPEVSFMADQDNKTVASATNHESDAAITVTTVNLNVADDYVSQGTTAADVFAKTTEAAAAGLTTSETESEEATAGSTLKSGVEENDNTAAEAAPPAEPPVSEPAPEPVAPEPQQILTSVPFDAKTQQQILNKACRDDLKRFCLAMAIAKKESQFVANLIGDNGQSFGYYQIKLKWHKARLAKYGYTQDDLFDPVKGAVVCIDYIEELLWQYQGSGDVSHALLMMYNQGPDSARKSMKHMVTSTEYSREVMGYYKTFLAEAGVPDDGAPLKQ